jgi:hypothetical protein
LAFLLAGGHAVIVHGHPRNTFDIDLIIRRNDQALWVDLARNAGYCSHRERPTFLQFNPANAQLLPPDLMLVGDETFAKLMADAVPAPAGAAATQVVSLRHPLALKCHAIKHGHAGRSVRDADDVLCLAQANRLDVDEPGMRELFLKHGTAELYERPDDSADQGDSAELELPDWNGMDESSARVSRDHAFQLCAEYRAWFPELAGRWQLQRPERCLAEFVL